jgi:hypothetical protein
MVHALRVAFGADRVTRAVVLSGPAAEWCSPAGVEAPETDPLRPRCTVFRLVRWIIISTGRCGPEKEKP